MTGACRSFDGLIARVAQLSGAERKTLEAHLAGCSDCRELARTFTPAEEDAPDEDRNGDDFEPLSSVDPSFYVRESKVGEGGMGITWRARDRRLGRTVVIKELKPRAGPSMRPRFEREARLTARLQHPAIVSVHEVGQWPDGQPFFAMELVHGRSLDAEIARRTSLAERLALVPAVRTAAEAVAYAHRQRIIHRDLTPRNILVGDFGEVVVIDWGLAKDLDDHEEAASASPYRESDGLTEFGVGTPSYMPPEQARGEPPDERVDVYALGAVLHHLISGQPPYGTGDDGHELRRKLLVEPPRRLVELVPDCPAELASLVARAMARDPVERMSSAKEFADELERFQTGRLLASHRYSAKQLLLNWARRHRAVLRLVVAALVLLGVVATLAVRRVVVERDRANHMVARLLQEEGHRELMAGEPLRAAVYLADAYRRGLDTPALRVLLAAVLRPLDAHHVTLEHQDRVDRVFWIADQDRVITQSGDGLAHVWDLGTGRSVAAFQDPTAILGASVSPDGLFVATIDEDGSAHVRNIATGKILSTLRGHQGSASLIVFSPDGRRLATGGRDMTVRIWDVATRASVHTFLAGPGDGLTELAWRGDVVSAATVGDVRTWNVTTGLELAVSPNHRPGPQSLALRSDGNELAHALLDVDVVVHEVLTGVALRLDTRKQAVFTLAYSPDGKMLAAGTAAGTVMLWQLDGVRGSLGTGATPPSFELNGDGEAIRHLAFSNDGRLVISSGSDGVARILDATTGIVVGTLVGHTKALRMSAFSPDGARVASASLDQTVRIWDTSSAIDVVPLAGHHGNVNTVAVSSDHARIVTAGEDSKIIVRNQHGDPITTFSGSARITVSAFRPDGRQLLTAGWDGAAQIWDPHTGKLVATLAGHHDRILDAAWSPDGTRVATASDDGTARVWDLRTSTSTTIARHADGVTCVAFSPDGQMIVTGSYDGSAHVWHADGSTTSVAHLDGVRSVGFAPNGRTFVTASDDGTAVVWNVAGKRLVILEGHAGTIAWSGFDPSGRRILTAGFDGSARLFAADTGRLVFALDGHTAAVVAARWSPDGAELATGSHDGTVRLWDASSGRLVSTLRTASRVATVAFNGDSSIVAAGSNGTASIWDVRRESRSPEQVAEIVKRLVPWRLAGTALLPASVDRRTTQPPPVRIDENACERGDSIACARVINVARVLDILPLDDGSDIVLMLSPSHDAPVLIDPYGGENKGGDLYAFRIGSSEIRPFLLARNTWPPQLGALGRRGSQVHAFTNVRRRGGTYFNDGLIYRIDLASRSIARDVLYTEWNAGYAPWFEDGQLIHYSFSDGKVMRGADRAGDPTYAGVTWPQPDALHRRKRLERMGLPAAESGVIEVLAREHVVRKWRPTWAALDRH